MLPLLKILQFRRRYHKSHAWVFTGEILVRLDCRGCLGLGLRARMFITCVIVLSSALLEPGIGRHWIASQQIRHMGIVCALCSAITSSTKGRHIFCRCWVAPVYVRDCRHCKQKLGALGVVSTTSEILG